MAAIAAGPYEVFFNTSAVDLAVENHLLCIGVSHRESGSESGRKCKRTVPSMLALSPPRFDAIETFFMKAYKPRSSDGWRVRPSWQTAQVSPSSSSIASISNSQAGLFSSLFLGAADPMNNVEVGIPDSPLLLETKFDMVENMLVLLGVLLLDSAVEFLKGA